MSPTAVDYVRAGYVLVPIPYVKGKPVKGPQGPTSVGWNLEANGVRTVEQAELLNGCNIGLAHAWSRTCCLDVDDYLAAVEWLAKRGIHLDAYLAAEDAVQIVSGRANRAKLCYRLPEGVAFLPHVPAHDRGFELRCAERNGVKTLQDCLPPSVHPDTGRPYEWKGDWRNFPVLPEVLLVLWRELANGPRPSPGHAKGGKVREGDRNAFLLSLAGSMRRRGMGERAIYAALLVENEEKCLPSLPRAEVAKISASVAKYPPGEQHHEGPGEIRALLARGDTLNVEPIRWLWDGWLARGKLHMLAGAPGTGKSTIASALAATTTTGGQRPDGTKCTPGDVIVWSDEDDPEDTLLPRFLAAGGDPKRLHIVTGTADNNGVRQFDPATDIPALLAETQKVPACALLIVDPVVTIVPGDSHKNVEVRRALRPLVGLASAVSTAVLGISHFTKGTAGGDPVERVTGSVAFGALPRVVMAAAKFCEGDTERRIFCRAKSNIGPDTGGWEYRLALTDVPGVENVSVVVARWGETLSGSARDLLANADASSDPEERGKMDEAVDWLRELLENGPMDSKWIASDAKQAGIAWPTALRAKTRLGVKAIKADFSKGWRWSLPEHSDESSRARAGKPESDDHLRKPTPLKASCGAGSAEGDQVPEKTPLSTPLKPSPGAGSAEGDQCSEKSEDLDHLRSNLGVVRVPGDSDAQDDQGGPLYRDVVITIDHGKGSHRSFEAHDPEGQTLAAWEAKVLAAHGDGSTVRPAPVNGGV
jgi:putative DNA primase/helicase